MMGDTTATGTIGHNTAEHQIVPIDLTANNIMVGTGFTINAASEWRLSDIFYCRWYWC